MYSRNIKGRCVHLGFLRTANVVICKGFRMTSTVCIWLGQLKKMRVSIQDGHKSSMSWHLSLLSRNFLVSIPDSRVKITIFLSLQSQRRDFWPWSVVSLLSSRPLGDERSISVLSNRVATFSKWLLNSWKVTSAMNWFFKFTFQLIWI